VDEEPSRLLRKCAPLSQGVEGPVRPFVLLIASIRWPKISMRRLVGSYGSSKHCAGRTGSMLLEHFGKLES
jgi:hypothetical protein